MRNAEIPGLQTRKRGIGDADRRENKTKCVKKHLI
jgi:hypothetical protein